MSKLTAKLLRDWVRAGCKKPGKSGKGLAAVLGMSPSQVSRMLMKEEKLAPGKKPPRRVRLDELQTIAEYIEEPIPTGLLSGDAATNSNRSLSQTAMLGGEQAVPLVRVTVVIAPLVWREVGVSVAIAERVAASPDPRVSGMKQYACKIESENGRFAVCVPYFSMRREPLANDVVHVRRTEGGRYEDTLRIVRIVRGQIQLQIDGAKGREGMLNYPSTTDETIEIKGLVVGYHISASF